MLSNHTLGPFFAIQCLCLNSVCAERPFTLPGGVQFVSLANAGETSCTDLSLIKHHSFD